MKCVQSFQFETLEALMPNQQQDVFTSSNLKLSDASVTLINVERIC